MVTKSMWLVKKSSGLAHRAARWGVKMPNFENNNMCGTLFITFDADFPKGELSDDDKESIAKILNQEPINKGYDG